jgi:hypothetical protein
VHTRDVSGGEGWDVSEWRLGSRMTEEERCRLAGVDPESVVCPRCFAYVGWACEETDAGRYGGSHANDVHPARARLARKAALASQATRPERSAP